MILVFFFVPARKERIQFFTNDSKFDISKIFCKQINTFIQQSFIQLVNGDRPSSDSVRFVTKILCITLLA